MIITFEQCEEYQRLYNVFGEHYDEGIRILKEILDDETRKAQLEEAAKIVAECRHAAELKTAPVAADNAIRYFACLANLEKMRSGYLERGFSREELENMMGCFRGSLNSAMAKDGVFGYNVIYLWWTGLFITNEIFKFMGKELEIRTYVNNVIWLRHKETKEIRPLLMKGKVLRSGYLFGSGGCTEEEGSYPVFFEETDSAFAGNRVERCYIRRDTVTYEKKDWEVFLKPGDQAVAFHFPKNADISGEALESFFREGQAAVRDRYPDFDPKCYMCTSWLLDEKMQDFLKPGSNILGFQKMMHICPLKGDGMSVFGYVFPPHCEDFEALPENSSLERGLKKLYLSGDRIYNQLGIRPFEAEE